MDELAKTEARNYLSAAGFFILTATFLIGVFSAISNLKILNDSIHIALGIGLLIVATLLIVLHKRDMIAILFFMMGFFQLFCAFTSPGIESVILAVSIILVALVTLTGQDKKKWLLFLIPAIWFIMRLIKGILGYNWYVSIVFYIILAVICLYYAFCCASERISLPGGKLLTADESTDFKASGSVLGYMLFAFITGGWAVFNFAGGSSVLSIESLKIIELLCGCLMVFVAILLLTVGRMRFTPVMFLLMAVTSILGVYSSGTMMYGIAILYLVIGLFAILRKESRVLPGIMLIVLSAVYFIIGAVGSGLPMVVTGILNAIPCLIAIYLAFVVYSQRKLPKF